MDHESYWLWCIQQTLNPPTVCIELSHGFHTYTVDRILCMLGKFVPWFIGCSYMPSGEPDKRSCCSLPSWIISWGPWSSWKATTSPPLYSLFTSWEDPKKTTFSPLIMVQWKIAVFGDLPLKVIVHFQPQLMDPIFHPWDASLIKRPPKNSSLRTNCLATSAWVLSINNLWVNYTASSSKFPFI